MRGSDLSPVTELMNRKVSRLSVKSSFNLSVLPLQLHVSPSPRPFFHPSVLLSFFFFFLAALGLPCCTRAFSSCSKRGLLFVAVCGLLIVVASLVVEHGL